MLYLVVAGDIDIEKTKKMVQDYFGPIPRGADIARKTYTEEPITETIKTKFYDPNIQIPLLMMAYRTPAQTERDAYVLDMISTYLSSGQSSKIIQENCDDEKRWRYRYLPFRIVEKITVPTSSVLSLLETTAW